MAKKKVRAKKLLRSRARTMSTPIASSANTMKYPSRAKRRSLPVRETSSQARASSDPRPTAETSRRNVKLAQIIPQLSRGTTRAISRLTQATERGGVKVREVVVAAIPPLKQHVNKGVAVTRKVALGVGHEVGETASRLANTTAKVTSDITAKTQKSIATALPPLKQRVARGYKATKEATLGIGHEFEKTTSRVAKKMVTAVRDRSPSEKLAQLEKNLERRIADQVDDAVAQRVSAEVAQCFARLEERLAFDLNRQIAGCVREQLEPRVSRQLAAVEQRLSKELSDQVKAARDQITQVITERLSAWIDRRLDAAAPERAAETRIADG